MFQAHPGEPPALAKLIVDILALGVALAAFVVSTKARRFTHEVTRKTKRAWVVPSGKLAISQEGVEAGSFSEVGSFSVAEKPYRVALQLQNSGGGPALNFATEYAWNMAAKEDADKFIPASPSQGVHGVIDMPGTLGARARAYRIYNFRLSPGMLDDIIDSRRILFIYGRCAYTDIFEQAHETTWCYRYTPQDLSRSIVSSPHFSRHSKYNSVS